jgi:UDP-N-acetylmuramyl tripeptide synthase
MPGRVARFVNPAVTTDLAAQLPQGVIAVTGTNGKTTTSRLVSHIFGQAGMVSVHNRAGANLAAGVAAALVQSATLGGRPQGDVGVFEIDEAALPAVRPALRPHTLVLTNLFRDQLDRYGEIDIVAGRWRGALRALDPSAAVIFNADDPLVSEVGRAHPGPRVPFGINDDTCSLGTLEHAADARYCYECGIPYDYRSVYFGHMGDYRCPNCGTTRPDPVVAADEITSRGIDGSVFALRSPWGTARVRTTLPGVYNIHNVLAAAACALHRGIPLEVVVRAIETFTPAFGRAERVHVAGGEAILLLAKNPAGFNEVLRTMLRAGGSPVALIAINDLIADGRDISWLWDVDFEMLAGRVRRVIVSGLRAEDMAVRLKYAGVDPAMLDVRKDLGAAFDAGQLAADGSPLYVLPTYTAMLQLRAVLQRRGVVRGFRDD